jgi:hypothetical protein
VTLHHEPDINFHTPVVHWLTINVGGSAIQVYLQQPHLKLEPALVSSDTFQFVVISTIHMSGVVSLNQ